MLDIINNYILLVYFVTVKKLWNEEKKILFILWLLWVWKERNAIKMILSIIIISMLISCGKNISFLCFTPLEWQKRFYTRGRERGIRVPQLAEIPTLFMIDGDHWTKGVIIWLHRKGGEFVRIHHNTQNIFCFLNTSFK